MEACFQLDFQLKLQMRNLIFMHIKLNYFRGEVTGLGGGGGGGGGGSK